jgi:hypothetical protein
MLNLRFTLITVALALLLPACAAIPARPLPTGTPTLAPTSTDHPPAASMAIVQSVEVQIIENAPPQAHAIVRGQLPDSGCTTISGAQQKWDGDTIRVTLTTTTDPLALCAPALTDFVYTVILDTSDLPPSSYTVEVNGVEQEFDFVTRDAARFEERLVEALNAQNYDLLQGLMDESLTIALWRSQGGAYPAPAALEQLQRNYLGGASTLKASTTVNLIELLGGLDPFAILGMEPSSARALHVSGWGLEGKDEAILYIKDPPEGELSWSAVLIAPGGFEAAPAGTGNNPPVDTSAYPTSVQYVMAQQDITIYNGPGTDYSTLGQIFSGQIALVTGTNATGDWWRVTCPDDTDSGCWVSADPSYTSPTQSP